MKKYIILSTLFMLLAVQLISVQARTWKVGTLSIEGEYAGMTDHGTKVRIQKTNGEYTQVALEQLSEEDQDFVRDRHIYSSPDRPFKKEKSESAVSDKPVTPVKEIPKENWYAFIVGVNVYADEQIDNLKCCVSDATALAEKFKALGFPEENITLLVDSYNVNQQPTKENIESKLQQLVSNLPENSLIIFSFSGHGIELKGKGPCFVPTDVKYTSILSSADEAEYLSRLASAVVSARDVSDWLERSKAQVKLILVDACREKVSRNVKSLRGLNNLNIPKGLAFLQSCSYGEFTHEDRPNRHGYFTLTFLEALDGKADADRDGVVTLSEIFSYTSKETEIRVKKDWAATQRPFYSFNGATIQDFPFVTGLLVDGLTKEQRDEAEGYYQTAHKLFLEKRYQEAKENIDLAVKIYPQKTEYQNEQLLIGAILKAINAEASAQISRSFVMEGTTLVKYVGKEADVVIPDCVTKIGKNAFANCKFLTSVVIPETVTEIEGSWNEGAFRDCTSLTTVSIPKSLNTVGNNEKDEGKGYIGVGAFAGCTSLKKWQIAEDHPTLKNNEICLLSKDGKCLIACPAATGEYKIPDGVQEVCMLSFSRCTSLTSVMIPDSVTLINIAFVGCSSLKKWQISEKNSKFKCDGACLLSKDGKILITCPSASGEFEIPDGIIKIEQCAFNGCNFLRSIKIPDSVTEIGVFAFDGCTSLKDWHISENQPKFKCLKECLLTKEGILIACPSATNIYWIPDGVTGIYQSVFQDNISLKVVVIPEGVTSIEGSAFCGCSSLTSVVIPDGVTKIGEYTFAYCSSLTSVVIPDSVTEIGEYTFAYCSSLTSVVIPGSETKIGSRAFDVCPNLKIHTPKGSRAEGYARANNIKFGRIR